MKPDVDLVLRVIAAKLVGEIGPAVPDDYARSNLEVAAGLLIAAAEDYDRAAEVRVEENRAMRAIFREAGSVVVDRELRDRLLAAAESVDPGLRVSALDAENARLRTLLVELHAHVEARPEDWARTVERAIWRELAASASRRAIGFYPL
jgi:hypothetical protein